MNVKVIYRSDPERELKDPLPEKDGIVFRLMTGDVVWPFLDPDGMFKPLRPMLLVIFRSVIPLPFFAWRRGNKKGYAGFKCFGVDSPEYKTWMPAGDVYEGSIALQPSFRMSMKPD